ncbi:MAG: hypothetical protein AB8H80_22560 [Planctomycetota bacterium]
MIAPRRHLALLALAAVSAAASACGETKPTTPQLTLRPIALGGEHENMLEKALGELQGYRLRYDGPKTRWAVTAEVFERGKTVSKQSIAVGSFPGSMDMTLGLIAREPQQDGASATDLSCVLSMNDAATTLHRSVLLANWDLRAKAGTGEATSVAAWLEPQTIDLTNDAPTVLWRWCRGTDIPLQVPLSAPVPTGPASCLQVSIQLGS